MISIVLLVMISVAIYQATTQTFRYRAKLINEGDFYGGIRLAMGLIDRDVSALFSPVNLNPKINQGTPSTGLPADAQTAADSRTATNSTAGTNPTDVAQAQQLEELLRSEIGRTTDFWLGATDITGIRPSRFVGTENRLQFVTAAHQRVYKNFQESEFAKIIYELRDDPNPDKLEGTRLLVKIQNPNVFDDIEKKDTGTKIYPLLPGLKRFRFRYYRKDKKAWERAWDTDRDDMKGLYPDLIELSIEVEGLNKLTFRGTYMFKPETPFYGLDATL